MTTNPTPTSNPTPAASPTPGPDDPPGLLLHVMGEIEALSRAAVVARNARAELGCPIEVIVQGPLVAVVTDDRGAPAVDMIADSHARLILCANSLRGAHIDPDTVSAGVVVSAAVTYLARRQADGWSYVRL